MKLEDVFLYLVLEWRDESTPGLGECVRAAIGGGVDMIQLRWNGDTAGRPDADAARAVRDVCREEDALLVVRDDADLAAAAGLDGVHLADAGTGLGMARAVVGPDKLIGVSSHSPDEATLALELGPDYLLHHAGEACPAALAGFRGLTAAPLFAAGLDGLDAARNVVEGGMKRLCIDGASIDRTNIQEEMAGYSRLLGRCI